MSLKLKLFGKPVVTYSNGNGPSTPPLSPKGISLLAYLTVTGHPHSREVVADLLWGEADEKRARRSLRVELSRIKSRIGPFIEAQKSDITLNQNRSILSDVTHFETYLAETDYGQGIELYSGQFMLDFDLPDAPQFGVWQQAQRSRLHQQVLDAYHSLIAQQTEARKYEAGIATARKLLTLEPWLEEGHRQLIELLVLNGQRSAALTQYERCKTILMEELGVTPAAPTIELHRQILVDEIGPDEQPLTVAPARTPFQAPPLTKNFVGRLDEMDEIEALLANGRQLVGLVGMGGIGKTTLAIRLAHALKSDFPDGVLWADVAHSEPFDILAGWGDLYGFDFSGLGDVKSRAAAVRNMLADKRCLIVLDDVTQVVRGQALLVGGEGCTTLLTTRNLDVAHGLEAAVLPLNELAPADGLTLLHAILGEQRIAPERDAAVTLTERLHNLPLALEIAAKRLKSRPRRTLAALATRLEETGDRLGLEIADQAVRTSFEVSWEGLDAEQKRLFSLLGVFQGLPFSAEALAAVAALDTYQTEEHLFSLAALSLVKEDGEIAYKQHPLLADYAEEKLAEQQATYSAARGRMADYYYQYAAANRENYDALRLWWANFMAGISVAHAEKNKTLLINYIDTLDEPWFRNIRFSDLETTLNHTLPLAEADNDLRNQGRILFRLGEIAFERDDFKGAQKLVEKSLNFAMQLEELTQIAKARLRLGFIYDELLETDKALKILSQCEADFSFLNDEASLAVVYLAQGYTYYNLNLEQAFEHANRAYTIQRHQPHNIHFLSTLRFLATISIRNEDFKQAENFCVEAVNALKTVNDLGEYGGVLYLLGRIKTETGFIEEAYSVCKEALEIFNVIGSLKWQAYTAIDLGHISKRLGEIQKAKNWYEKALFKLTSISYKPGIALCFVHLYKIATIQKKFEEVALFRSKALNLAKQLNSPTIFELLDEEVVAQP